MSAPREIDWLAAARQYIRELPEPPMGSTVDVLLQMLADENERLRAFAFGDAPEWEKANTSLKHRVRELEAENERLREALVAAHACMEWCVILGADEATAKSLRRGMAVARSALEASSEPRP